MNIKIISDTHNQHAKLGLLSGDVLIHCGDMFDLYKQGEADLRLIDEWFGKLDFKLILCTGGNHDLLLEELVQSDIEPFNNAVFLQDKRYDYEGVVFYGAPWVPKLKRQAFFKSEEELQEKWARIPDDTDVLITHTPPFAVLDETSRGRRVGCKHLASKVRGLAPRLHCFGHVHNSAGQAVSSSTIFVNASSVNSRVEISQQPFEIDL